MKAELNETDKQIYEQLKRLHKNWPGLDLPNAEKWKKDRLKFNREIIKILKGGLTKNGRKTKHRKLG